MYTGLICALNNASQVVISDYGHDADLSLVYAIDINLKSIAKLVGSDTIRSFFGVGYIWGNPVDVLTNPAKAYQKIDTMSIDTESYDTYVTSKLSGRIQRSSSTESAIIPEEEKFDIILSADLLFNRSEHSKLLWTIKHTLRREGGVCYVTFSHHDPAKKLLDLNFFTLAREPQFNFEVTFIGQEFRKSYPFVESDGLDEERGVVYMYTLTCK